MIAARRVVGAAATVLALVTACSDDGADVRDAASGSASASGSVASGPGAVLGAGFGFGDADTVVVADAREYRFRVDPVIAPGPRIVLHLRNGGEASHELEVVDASDAVVGEVPRTSAGRERALAVELRPGDYVLRCRLPSPGGATHESRGMRTDIRVT